MNHATVQYPLKPNTTNTDTLASPMAASDEWAGKVIGEYEIERLIGQGGMGQVYQARHRWLQLPVAIKVLQHLNTNNQNSLDRFQREAQIAARLRHPNLVRCTDGGVIGEKLFLVTDFVDGEDLYSLVKRGGPLSVPDASELIRQTAIALQFIVDNDTIHRDIKPANIMLDRDGTVRVLDMGLARCTINQETLTETGQVMGTLDYMAPEQAADSRQVDFRADLYSLGCTFYFLLTGQAPFSTDDNSTLAAKILAHLESEHPPIKEFRRDVPKPIIELIDKLLDKTPDRRPESFRSVASTLEPSAKQHQVAKLLSDSATSALGDIKQSRQRQPGLVDRIAGSFRSAMTMLFRFVLIVLGFLDRTPPTRPGQKPSYHFSFRWLKASLAFGALGFAFWFSGIEFIPANEAPGSLLSGPSHDAGDVRPTSLPLKESVATQASAPEHASTPPTPPQHPRPPHLGPPPHPGMPGASRPRPPAHPSPHGPNPSTIRSQGIRYNEFN